MPQIKQYTIKQLEKKFKNKWLLVRVLREDKNGRPKKVEVIKHAKDRDNVYQALEQVEQDINVATLFMGEPLEEGYAAAFILRQQ